MLATPQLDADLVGNTYAIVVFYNLACCYQKLNMLDVCSEYLSVAIQRLNHELASSPLAVKTKRTRMSLERVSRLQYQVKFHLQQCAVLSQLNL